MQAHELDSLLGQLRRASTPAEKARISRRLKDAQSERWFDRLHEQAVQRIAAEVGARVPAWQPPAPGVGETWVLLFGDGCGQVAPLTVHPRPLQLVAPELKYELERALAGLYATLGCARRRLPHALYATHVEIAAVRVVGASLGVAACVGWMSRALGVPVPTKVVATAQVSPTGELELVDHLGAKLAALRERLLQVEKVVVAAKQPELEHTHGFELVRCEKLSDALHVFGLSASQLQVNLSAEQYERDHEELKHLENKSFGAEEWIEHARRAQEVACGLASFGEEALREKAAEARIRAALFALHGGDPAFAEELLAQVSADSLPLELAALSAVVKASKSIDAASGAASAEARMAVELSESLSSKRAKREVLGRAYGTLGRALMHADAFEEALPWLRNGADFHREHAPREHARSLCYVAQCLRGLGRPADALETVRAALAFTEAQLATAEKTRAYLRLEEGRALLALGRASEALDAFEYVIDCQGNDSDHPRISGLRGTAAALQALEKVDAAKPWFGRCRAIAEARNLPRILREIATLAIGDVLACEGDAAEPALWALWTTFFAEYATHERLLWRVHSYVY
jgi:tetratricopeptide (TPR) repeat protein